MKSCAIGRNAAAAAAAAAKGPIGTIGPTVLLLVAVALPASAQTPQWRPAVDKEGIMLESRPLPGERFDELRASTLVPVAPKVVADFLVGPYLDQENSKIRRTFVKRTRELTIWSDVVTAPGAGTRCYSMRFERSPQAATGEVTVRFSSAGYIGAMPVQDCIALHSRGEWRMRPVGTGTRITYTSLTDIGGSMPAMLVRGSLSSAAVSSLRQVAAGALVLHAQRQDEEPPADPESR